MPNASTHQPKLKTQKRRPLPVLLPLPVVLPDTEGQVNCDEFPADLVDDILSQINMDDNELKELLSNLESDDDILLNSVHATNNVFSSQSTVQQNDPVSIMSPCSMIPYSDDLNTILNDLGVNANEKNDKNTDFPSSQSPDFTTPDTISLNCQTHNQFNGLIINHNPKDCDEDCVSIHHGKSADYIDKTLHTPLTDNDTDKSLPHTKEQDTDVSPNSPVSDEVKILDKILLRRQHQGKEIYI